MKVLKRSLAAMLVLAMVFALVVSTAVTSSANSYVIQRQLEAKWKNYYYGGGNLYNTGCGIFSLVNAVGYLTGNSMSITEVASWAHSINAFNVNGGDGTYRLVLYPKVQAKYGATYGFTLDCGSQNQGWWSGSSNTTLKNHLANGGVAVGHVPGHFIALVGYDSATNKFHVYDSAPSTARGTNTTGATGLGDCWVTQSQLATGKLKLDWFCLLSSTGASAEYLALEELINESLRLICVDYNQTEVKAIRTAYTQAKAVYQSTSSTATDYKNAYNALYAAIHSDSNSVSKGKTYTATTPTRTDKFADDGKRLTDGVKGDTNGGAEYSGWQGSTEIVVDLGSSQAMNTFVGYFAAGAWGISIPFEVVNMEVSYSNSGTAFTTIGSSTNAVLKYGSGIASTEVDEWSTYETTIISPNTVYGRYVKFSFTHYGNGHIWLDEVEASNYTDPLLSDRVYINRINDKVRSGDSVIFTSGYGEISTANANHAWTQNLIAVWSDAVNGFVVKSNANGGGTAANVTLADNEIMIAAHPWEGVSDSVPGSLSNANRLAQAKVGDVIRLNGVDTYNGWYDVLAYATIVPKEEACSHNYNSVVTAPTCTEDGYTTHTCTLCGHSYVDSKQLSKGHTAGQWETLADGSQEQRCEDCGELLDTKPAPEYKSGDVNADGNVDIFDYLVIKNIYFDKYTATAEEKVRGDVNADGVIDVFDYMMVKTVCMS